MQIFEIAATDLTFLLSGCERCFHHKVVNGWRKPSEPFPSVFRVIDTLMSEALDGIPLPWQRFEEVFAKNELGDSEVVDRILLEEVPGTYSTKSTTLKSVPIEIGPGVSVVFKGRDDGFISYADGSGGVRDMKASDQKDENVQLYWRQLSVYRACRERPAKGDAIPIRDMGLIAAVPRKMHVPNGTDATFDYEVSQVPVPINPDEWDAFLMYIHALLIEEPPKTLNCPHCALRESGWKPIKKSRKKKVAA